MKKVILQTSRFVIWGVAVLYLLMHITYVLRPDIDAKRNFMGFYYEKKDSLDVVFIGPSTILYSINPLLIYDEYGIASYMIGTEGQSPSFLYYLLKEARKTQPDAVYFIDISAVGLDDELWQYRKKYLRHVTDGLKYSWNRMACNYEQIQGMEDQISYYFDIIKYHSEWENFSKNVSHWNFEVENPDKGFLLHDEATSLAPFVWQEEAPKPLDEKAEQTLIKLLEYCKENQINVEFIIGASTTMAYGTAEYVRELVESYEFELFVFNDYLEDIRIDYSNDFFDTGHLNTRGAQKATHFFGKYISDKYSFADRREDENYASWDANLTQMKEKVENDIERIELGMLIGDIEANYQIQDNNTVVFTNQTKAKNGSDEVEIAWNIYEKSSEYEEWYYIDSQWYSTSDELMYKFDTDKQYQVQLIVRMVEHDDINRGKIIFQLHFDGQKWVVEDL